MSSPPVGLVQWLSDITSSPQQRLRCAMSLKGSAKNGGAPSRQLRRGIERRLHKIKTKKTKPQKVPEHTKQKQGNLRSRPIKDTERQETTLRKQHKLQREQPREDDTPAKVPKKLGNTKKLVPPHLPRTTTPRRWGLHGIDT